jgi:hypothetical protein
MSGMASGIASMMPSTDGGGGGGGFWDTLSMLKPTDPFEVLKDPNATAMQKFLAVLGSTKVGVQSGGSSFGFQGPNADMNPMLAKLMSQMMKGDRNSAKTTSAADSLLLNKKNPVPGPVDVDPLRALSMAPRWQDFTGWGKY